jgi:hypothetical protein
MQTNPEQKDASAAIMLFNKWQQQDHTTVVQLLNKDHIPVAALYLDQLDLQNIAICQTKTSEKYYLYMDGVAIFFSYYRKS